MSDDDVITIRAGWRRAHKIRFGPCCRPFADYLVDYIVEVDATGLKGGVRVRSVEGDELPGFLRQLAESYRGWPDVRRWRSFETLFATQAG